MKKLLFISHSSYLAGAQRSLLEAMEVLHDRGMEIHLILPAAGGLNLLAQPFLTSLNIVHYPWWIKGYTDTNNPFTYLYRCWCAIRRIETICRYVQPDLVITNTTVIPCGAIAAKLAGIPHIWYIRELLEKEHDLELLFGKRLSYFFISTLSHKVIVNSEVVLRKISRYINVRKLAMIYNAITMPAEKYNDRVLIQKNPERFYVGIFGTVVAGKGQELAIRAVAQLVKNNLDLHLWIVGNGASPAFTQSLTELVRTLGIEDRVEFLPFLDNPYEYMRASDIVLVCSTSEAFGRVTIEAMKLGKAVIGADSGATSELIRSGWNGLLYEAGNESALVEKIRLIYYDSEMRKQLAHQALQWATEMFTKDRYGNALEACFGEAYDKSANPR